MNGARRHFSTFSKLRLYNFFLKHCAKNSEFSSTLTLLSRRKFIHSSFHSENYYDEFNIFNTHKFPLQAYAVNKNKLLWLQPQILTFFIWKLELFMKIIIYCLCQRHHSDFMPLWRRKTIRPLRRYERAQFFIN